MARNDRPVLISPSASYGVEVGAADTTSDNLDVDVAVTEGLGLELRSRHCQKDRHNSGAAHCCPLPHASWACSIHLPSGQRNPRRCLGT